MPPKKKVQSTADDGQTHYDGCWHTHHACALWEIARLEAEVARLTELVTVLEDTIVGDAE